MLMTFLSVILLIVCAVLVFLVLSQDAKGGGLAGALGGGAAQTAFGGRSAESVTKLTTWMAVAFFLIVVMMGVFGKTSSIGLTDTDETPGAGVPTDTDR